MPDRANYDLQGLLLRDRHGDPVLEVDGGGTWRLDLSVRAEPMLGQRVEVVGRRAGFDLLDVQEINLVGVPRRPPARGWRALFQRRI